MSLIYELDDSRSFADGDNPSGEMKYGLEDVNNPTTAGALLLAYSPSTWLLPTGKTMVRQDYSVEPLGGGVWDGTVHFGLRDLPGTNEYSVRFSTKGGTQHITQSYGTRIYHADGVTPPTATGAINETRDGVQGVDIVVPAFSWSENHIIPAASVSDALTAMWMDLTGKINSEAFRHWPAGTVRFDGVDGSRRGSDDWDLNFDFVAQRNQTSIAIGADITVERKDGWEYLWVRYVDHVNESRLMKKPDLAYVEQVYETASFSSLGLPS